MAIRANSDLSSFGEKIYWNSICTSLIVVVTVWLFFFIKRMLLFSTVKVFPEWNHFSEPWNVFFWVSHLHLKWTFVARACEGLQGSTRGANGSRIKNILGKEKWFHEETFYKLRMELCSMITGIVCFQWRKQWRKPFLHCFLHEWRKQWRKPFLHRFLHSWRKQWRKILKQWNQFSNPWKKTGKTWSNSSQNWTKLIKVHFF